MLAAYVDAYLEQVAELSYAELCADQPPPFATVGTGAAGIAYTLLRAHRAGRGDACLEHARRWAAEAWRAREEPGATAGGSFEGRPGSIAYGAAGIAFVAAWIAEATGDREDRDARIADLLAICERADGAAEHAEGAAGRLAALATLHAETRDAAVQEMADRTASGLVGAAMPGPGFAHGAAGVVHAQLRWARQRGGDPARALGVTARLAAVRFGDAPLDRGWCAGAAGLALLFASACEDRPELLPAARNAGEHAVADQLYDLCCGAAGRAYALLALDRVAPGEGWRDRALACARAAVTAAIAAPGPYPNGLLKGHPGVVCVALELLGGGVPRFPMVDG